MIENLEIPGATVYLLEYPSESPFKRLWSEIAWSQRSIIVHGRKVAQPRLTAWYGDASYTYSGIRNDPLPWTPLLLEIKATIEGLLGIEFNSVLLNLYRDGRDSIGYHSDDEKELGPEPIIASLSFGAERIFAFRHKRAEYGDVSVNLTDGSLLVMLGETQKNWLHGIAKVKEAGPRINLTFRRINP